MEIKNITVFCASSSQACLDFKEQAYRLGEILSKEKMVCYYGGGRIGLMGELAKAMVKNGGNIKGIIPSFMMEQGWGNDDVEEIVTEDMHSRKQKLMSYADAIVVLPGGLGTLDELFEALTARQLGIIKCPVVLVNVNGYFDSVVSMLGGIVEQKMMRPEHLSLCSVVKDVGEVIEAIKNAVIVENARGIAAM